MKKVTRAKVRTTREFMITSLFEQTVVSKHFMLLSNPAPRPPEKQGMQSILICKRSLSTFTLYTVFMFTVDNLCVFPSCSGEPSASLKQFGLKPDNGSEKCQSIEINDEETDMEVDSNATTGKKK